MFHSLPTWWLAVIASMASAAASGQPPPSGENLPSPRRVLTYRSALDGYQPFTDEKPIAWLQANETVHSRGGWQAYAREVSSSKVEAEAPKAGHAAASGRSGHSLPVSPMSGDMHHMPATKEKP